MWPQKHVEVTLHLVIPFRRGTIEVQGSHPHLLILGHAMATEVIVRFIQPCERIEFPIECGKRDLQWPVGFMAAEIFIDTLLVAKHAAVMVVVMAECAPTTIVVIMTTTTAVVEVLAARAIVVMPHSGPSHDDLGDHESR